MTSSVGRLELHRCERLGESFTVGSVPDENCFTLTGTDGLGIQLQPFLGSKRKFRLEKTQ
jgi:hypothetical protein